MKIDIDISSSEATNFEFAKVILQCETLDVDCVLDLEFSTLYDRCKIPDPIILDFLFLASMVYNVDKLVSREKTDDRWTRTLKLNVPVSDSAKWSTVKDDLETCLTFLTGDVWTIHFTDLQCKLHRPKQRKRRRRNVPPLADAHAVCLFSGGLDSLVGAINYLESHTSDKLFLVGHRDVPGPKSDQNRLYKILREHYQSRVDLLQVRVGQKGQSQDTTFRSRSFLFIALGIYAAHSIGERIPLLIPENGAIALNVPLTPSRRGSCSTRTAHPFFFRTLSKIIDELGIKNTLCNPLELKTKGECVAECRNRDLLNVAAPKSVSCAKRGHTHAWHNKTAGQCGMCLPCISRRASLHKVGWDNENYGRDICTGEVHLDSTEEHPNDFRALVSFLRRDVSKHEIASRLLANGPIEVNRLMEYADVFSRSIDEVRNLLRDKGTEEIQQRASLVS